MRIFFLIITSLSLFASEPKLKFENKVIDTIYVNDGRNFTVDFKILCLNGYQYLYRVSGDTNQMFYRDKKLNQSFPIECNGYEENK